MSTKRRGAKAPRYRVVDLDTGRVGWVRISPGYVWNGSYINEGWRIEWDEDQEPDES